MKICHVCNKVLVEEDRSHLLLIFTIYNVIFAIYKVQVGMIELGAILKTLPRRWSSFEHALFSHREFLTTITRCIHIFKLASLPMIKIIILKFSNSLPCP